MESWVLGLIVAVVNVMVTTVAGLIIKSIYEKKAKEREELEQLREEKRAASEGKRCDLVKSTIHEEIEALEGKINKEFCDSRLEFKSEVEKIANDLGLVKDGLQKDLYIDLINLHEKYVKKQKGASMNDKRDYDKLYGSYHNLGKNGVADHLHEEVMNLPDEPKGE